MRRVDHEEAVRRLEALWAVFQGRRLVTEDLVADEPE
jgi:hypothetical protein